jgi:hypothetical protein
MAAGIFLVFHALAVCKRSVDDRLRLCWKCRAPNVPPDPAVCPIRSAGRRCSRSASRGGFPGESRCVRSASPRTPHHRLRIARCRRGAASDAPCPRPCSRWGARTTAGSRDLHSVRAAGAWTKPRSALDGLDGESRIPGLTTRTSALFWHIGLTVPVLPVNRRPQCRDPRRRRATRADERAARALVGRAARRVDGRERRKLTTR